MAAYTGKDTESAGIGCAREQMCRLMWKWKKRADVFFHPPPIFFSAFVGKGPVLERLFYSIPPDT